ncbi:antibiotic biosynthesis monooxygenase family protein [Deinococcus sp. Marseille-Q6407]|uniref:antibiotic biosynthesis monooxygenase family protein n=1 Tax=Deinococcus sp. Marseille-Q6407 TaxID=2969223 RepID=UPI0021C0DED1|nr:antibiotic biosynthesis monooxygenase [Deinococcus sp. Marseille-Q6407]
MIAVANRIPVNPEHAGAFEERFLNRPGQVEERPGFLATHLLRPTAPGQPYTVLTYWESREAFEAWRQSPSFKEGHKGGRTLPEGTLAGRNELEIWEVFGRSGNLL